MVATRVKHLYVTFEHLIHEIAKFGIIGAVGFVLTFALNNAFHFGANLGPITSFSLATAIVAVLSYFANRHWTWAHTDNQGARQELPLFLLLSLIGLAISDIPVGISEHILGLHSALSYNISSTLIGTAMGTVWRFWSFRRWIFHGTEAQDTEAAAHNALV